MTASKKTIQEACTAINRMQDLHHVSDEAVGQLLLDLQKIDGNRSFKATVAALCEAYINRT